MLCVFAGGSSDETLLGFWRINPKTSLELVALSRQERDQYKIVGSQGRKLVLVNDDVEERVLHVVGGGGPGAGDEGDRISQVAIIGHYCIIVYKAGGGVYAAVCGRNADEWESISNELLAMDTDANVAQAISRLFQAAVDEHDGALRLRLYISRPQKQTAECWTFVYSRESCVWLPDEKTERVVGRQLYVD
jgi:hypothetical protein